MNRIEFIRKSILAVAGIAAMPLVVDTPLAPEPIDVFQAAVKQVEVYTLKVSKVIMNDVDMLDKEIRNAVGKVNKQLIETAVGWDHDDFSKEIYTIRLKFI